MDWGKWGQKGYRQGDECTMCWGWWWPRFQEPQKTSVCKIPCNLVYVREVSQWPSGRIEFIPSNNSNKYKVEDIWIIGMKHKFYKSTRGKKITQKFRTNRRQSGHRPAIYQICFFFFLFFRAFLAVRDVHTTESNQCSIRVGGLPVTTPGSFLPLPVDGDKAASPDWKPDTKVPKSPLNQNQPPVRNTHLGFNTSRQ